MRKIISRATVLKTICAIWPSTTMHTKRKTSIAAVVWGILFATRLSSSNIGRALARASGGTCSSKHSIKQVDRLLGNDGIDTATGIASYARWVVGCRREITVSLDWTSYGRNSHSTIMVNLITSHGRATPLAWRSVKDNMLKRRRNTYEREVLAMLKSILAPETKVTVVADRGFADTKFFRYIVEVLGWDYIIRIKENTYAKTEHMSKRKIRELTALNGRILEYKEVLLTAKEYVVGALVTIKAANMKEPWLLATSLQGQKERVVKLYGRRFTCEEHFRDTKDDRYGLGLKETSVSTIERRERMLLFHAIATVLLTLLGAAGEEAGLARKLKANTLQRRTHSLFCQGKEYVLGLLHEWAGKLRISFERLCDVHVVVTDAYWLV